MYFLWPNGARHVNIRPPKKYIYIYLFGNTKIRGNDQKCDWPNSTAEKKKKKKQKENMSTEMLSFVCYWIY